MYFDIICIFSYRFGIAPATASKYFRLCVKVMYCLFQSIVHWPPRKVLHDTMPACFKKAFKNKITVIIDCFEVFIERPSNLRSKAECWSSYKHHLTAKPLIAISPQGTVTFVSSGWGGRTSDKYITEHSGFMNKIEPGDYVLADRGFLIEETLNLFGAKLNIPAFTKGKNFK